MKKIVPLLLLIAQSVTAQVLPDSMLKNFTYRNIGPFRTGAWITSFAVPETPSQQHLYTFYVGTRNGGLWKTVNNGSSFENIFPYHHTIGAVAVAPSNAQLVWAGTGESYITRSSYSGDGVYLSTDAGKTWSNTGLRETQHISRILVHPSNPAIVYVASPGHLFTPNPERGVFKTTDGGKTWKKILFINDNTGVIDMVMHPSNPEILFAATYEKYRSAWNLQSGGANSAIYKSTNGGKSWTKLTQGLPSGEIGRIGIDICFKHPDILYAVIENLNMRKALPEEARQDSLAGRPVLDRQIAGEVYRSDDGGKNWHKVNRAQDNVGGKAAYSFNQIYIHPDNPGKVYVTGSNVANSTDGGKTWNDIEGNRQVFFPQSFGDVRTLWFDRKNPERILFGSDGGVHISYDGGKTCDFYDNLPIGEVYALDMDREDPYNIYAGLQDHDSWKGPSNGWSGQITLENWVPVGSDDGMYNVVDPTNSRWVYNTGQFGLHRRVDQEKGLRFNIEPKPLAGKPAYRYNWCTPLQLSPHDPSTIYTGGQVLLRSADRGDTWQEISPDLTTNDPARINGKGHIQFCTITTICESPVARGLIWVGTDDGKVQVTKDNGTTWNDVTTSIEKAGGPAGKWVSRVFASFHHPGTAYVSKTGFRDDDFKPYLFKTTDTGRTWVKLTDGLPDKPINTICEDSLNENLLFLGNDAGVYLSSNAGKKWQILQGNMPFVPVHDIKLHPRDKDLVVGTYGRGIWIADISYLEEFNDEILNSNAYLFKIEAKPFRQERTFNANYQLYGTRHIKAPNEPNGIVINFYLKNKPAAPVHLSVADSSGKLLYQMDLTAAAGLNTASWNMSMRSNAGRRSAEKYTIPGELVITLDVAGKKLVGKTLYKGVKGWPVN